MAKRKLIVKLAWWGSLGFWVIGVVANHGLGKIKAQTPGVVVGEIGFVSCCVIGVITQVVTFFRHRPAFRRLQARSKRKHAAEKPHFKSFRLAPMRRPPGDA